MVTARSFQSRIFLAILLVVAIPGVVGLGVGTLALREFVSASGTAGPWDQVGESGLELVEAIDSLSLDPATDSTLAELADRHRQNLSASVTLSRRYSFVASRTLSQLPVVAIGTAIGIALLALFAARHLSRTFSRPVVDLVGWTQVLARAEALPPASRDPRREVAEIAELRNALRTMAGELKVGREREREATKLRSWTEMARRVAHELKNPLTPMRMAATTIVRLDDPRSLECGQVLVEEIDRLDEMARSFAQFARMPEGPPAPIDLGELLTSVATRYFPDVEDLELDIEATSGMVMGHHEPLVRTFRNLLVNAQEAGSPVKVELTHSGDQLEVRIADSGPGIPENDLESIWAPDFTTKQKGTGLGLPMVRKTVEAHGGSVHAKTLARGGAEFTVSLPVTDPN